MKKQLNEIQKYGIFPTIEFSTSLNIKNVISSLIQFGIPFIGIKCDYTVFQNFETSLRKNKLSTIFLTDDIVTILQSQNIIVFEIPIELATYEHSKDLNKYVQNKIYEFMDLRLIHIGINTENNKESKSITDEFQNLFNLPIFETNGSYFVGTLIEVMKGSFLGQCGHIGIGTKNINLALAYYKAVGYEFNEASSVYNDSNELVLIYFKNEVGNFAVHLKQL